MMQNYKQMDSHNISKNESSAKFQEELNQMGKKS